MVILPAEPTDEMWSVLQELQDYEGYSGCGGITADEAAGKLVEASPNAGKVSRADLRRALADARTSGLRAIADLPESAAVDAQIRAHARAEEDAFAAALGLEIAEDGENG